MTQSSAQTKVFREETALKQSIKLIKLRKSGQLVNLKNEEELSNTVLYLLACVASVSVWFRSKERPRNGIFGFGRARKGNERYLPSSPPPRSFTRAIFHAVFDVRSSFFAPKPHGNACYAGYVFVVIIGGGYVSKGDAMNSTRNFPW